MSPWKVILATMVIFVCGIVTGAMMVKTIGPTPPPQRPGPYIGIPGQQPVLNYIRRMAQTIDLTLDQSNQVVKILLDSQETNTVIRKQYAPLLQAEAKRAHEAVLRLLTPDQQTKLEQLDKDEAGRRGMRGRRGGGGSNGPDTNGFYQEHHDGPRRRMQSTNPGPTVTTNTPGATTNGP